MLKLYNNERLKIFPINNSYNPTDHYTSIYKLHYKPIFYKENTKDLYKKQLKLCKRLCYGIKIYDKYSSSEDSKLYES